MAGLNNRHAILRTGSYSSFPPSRCHQPRAPVGAPAAPDSTGARLALSRQAAVEPVREALAFQRKHNLPTARVSRFAAIGLQLAPDSLRFRFVRGLVVCAAVIAYVAAVGELIVVVIPALAPGP
jgi:hypothetical protein